MNVWLITDGEILPTEKNAKKMRTWRLGEALSQRGHIVTWWSSNFFHIKKEKVSQGDIEVKLNDNFSVKLIDAGTYKKNISLARIIHHKKLAKYFHSAALKQPMPDVIIVSLPSLELVEKAIQYGEKFKVPVIIDVRDMWPDTFKNYFDLYIFKKIISMYAKILSFKMVKSIRNASAIVSMNNTVLNWALNKISTSKENLNIPTNLFYIGYDENNEQEFKAPKHSFPREKVIFLFIGTFGKSYDLESIISVAKRLNKENDNVCHFVIAGDGEKKSLLKMQAHGLKNVSLLGWVDKTESHELLTRADVFLMPILNDALPNKFFEGLYFGIPLLHCIDGEARQLTDKLGLGVFYDKSNMDDLYEKIVSMRDQVINGQIHQYKKNIGQNYDKFFSSSKIYGNYCNFIESIVYQAKRNVAQCEQ